jgi:hypothetical protein
MATKIKETPILRGKNARRFQRIMEENKNKKVSRQEYERAKAVYEQSKFS